MMLSTSSTETAVQLLTGNRSVLCMIFTTSDRLTAADMTFAHDTNLSALHAEIVLADADDIGGDVEGREDVVAACVLVGDVADDVDGEALMETGVVFDTDVDAKW
jgi:hypothetical protein